MVSIVALLSNEDKKSSSKDMGSGYLSAEACFVQLSAACPACSIILLIALEKSVMPWYGHMLILVFDDFDMM